MAFPTLQAQGTVNSVTTGNLSVTLPTYAANDIVVLTTVGHVPNTTTGTNTQTLASPWTKYTPAVTVITGGIIDSEYAFWWARATSSNSLGTSVSITRPTSWDTGTDTAWGGRAYVVRGCATTGDPFDQLVATAPSTAANPPLPAVTVNGLERTVIAFYVAADNLTAPTAATGYTPGTAIPNATGTDTNYQTYLDQTNTSVAAVTPTGGATGAQFFQVYFSASFAPPVTVVSRTASGSGLGAQSAIDVLTAKRTATGSGLGTESATGNRVAPVIQATASGSGVGTQTAVGRKFRKVTSLALPGIGLSGNMIFNQNSGNLRNAQFEDLGITVSDYAISFVATSDGAVSEVAAFFSKTSGATGTLQAEIWSHQPSPFLPLALLKTSIPLSVENLGIGNTTPAYLGKLQQSHFSFNSPQQLVNGARYWVVFRANSLSGTLAYWGQGFYTGISALYFKKISDGSWGTIGGAYPALSVQKAEATGRTVAKRIASGSGLGTESATGAIKKTRTATGVGTGTQTATGARVSVLYQRSASGAGVGTQTAVRNIRRRRRVEEFGQSTLSAVIRPTGNGTQIYTGQPNRFGQSFIGDGRTLASTGFHARKVNNPTGNAYARLYLASGGKPTGSPIAVSDPVDVSTLPISSTAINLVRFTFTNANKYLLVEGTAYVIVFEYTDASTFPNLVDLSFVTQQSQYARFGKENVGQFSQSSNGTIWNINAGYNLIHYVETASATGLRTVKRTSTASGTGTSTALKQIPPVGINWSYWGTNGLF